MKYPNFYETTKEAQMRLHGTVIWYDGPGEEGPYQVLAITDHIGDGKFRIYMKRLGQRYIPEGEVAPPNEQIPADHPQVGKYMDDFMKARPKYGIIRKEMNSPHFKGFRPFPLGMMNRTTRMKDDTPVDSETLFLERQPNRHTQQGLTRGMVYVSPVTAAMKKAPNPAGYTFDMWSRDFCDCIMGRYPNADLCLSKLRDHTIANEAIAFDRYFAFVRGPIDMLFLSYKGEIVGLLDNNNLSQITIGREHKYTREAVSELHIFSQVRG